MPHDELISKLEQFGFVDNSIACLTNYLSNRSQVVSLGGNLSVPLAVENGVPQGSILGRCCLHCILMIYHHALISPMLPCMRMIQLYFSSSAQLLEVELKLNMELTSPSQWLWETNLS